MRRVRLKAAYDGTDFSGFQLQPERRTVEGELVRALSELTGENISVIGASRTDSGVHALGNIAVFDTDSPIPGEKYMYALLPHLPHDLRIMSSDEVPPDWHPRHRDSVKTYRYSWSLGSMENPLNSRYTSFCKYAPDIALMREAAGFLVGEHDFTSFANPASQTLGEGGSAVRKIHAIEIFCTASGDAPAGGLISMTVCGSGFLYNMVRIIAGTLMDAGRGFTKPAEISDILKARDRRAAGPTAEAKGLCLMNIEYH